MNSTETTTTVQDVDQARDLLAELSGRSEAQEAIAVVRRELAAWAQEMDG